MIVAVYKYVGRTKKGMMKKGTIEAANKNQAISRLVEQGIRPREVTEAKGLLYREVTLGRPVKHQHFVIYCRQFATLIRAGIPIVKATNILARQTESKHLRKVLLQIEDELRSGRSFSEAAEKHAKVFPPMFTNMIRAGEATGSLDETLDRLAAHFEKQYYTAKKIQSALTYPVSILIIMIFVVVFLMIFIVPRFTDMFRQFGAELPPVTKMVMGMSHAVANYWWIGLLVLLAAAALFGYFMKNSKKFHYGVHWFLLRMPVFGNLLQKAAIGRTARTLSSLVSSSVPILEALTITERVAGNPVIGQVILEARESLAKGNRLSEPFEKSRVMPPLVTQMIAVGEQSGSLDFMLGKIADFYEAEVDRTVDTLKSLIEPVMIILLAGVVGTIVASIIIPLFSIYQQVL